MNPHPHLCFCNLTAVAICVSCSLRDLVSPSGWPEQTDGQLGWMPGSLRDDSWAGRGNLALKEVPAEICLLLARTGALGWKLCLGTLPFLVRIENNIYLVEIYRSMATWPWPDLKNKGSDMKSATTNHAHPSPFAFKGTCWKLSVTLEFLGHQPLISLYESVTNLSLFQTLMLNIDGPHCASGIWACNFSNNSFDYMDLCQ